MDIIIFEHLPLYEKDIVQQIVDQVILVVYLHFFRIFYVNIYMHYTDAPISRLQIGIGP